MNLASPVDDLRVVGSVPTDLGKLPDSQVVNMAVLGPISQRHGKAHPRISRESSRSQRQTDRKLQILNEVACEQVPENPFANL